ncbi:4-hydroxy-tetrahydrodipicolinate reductase [Oscillibacter sp. MSJ-2]|uniref:4-hydroxy-tetrahydrodipicolinate reductase n=1 Tax=Dysosmobacter acutus TaxID=2841504 RepID=A0ABS6F8N0_9FIRM|nr:4-hydroxy-tetrahydrodipicolinate reductase [Dysosmobacter acutus]MBU5625659.1 4-hydroxy-tetrahydrodipicolinate reductase [Dysosmobacter acutus]
MRIIANGACGHMGREIVRLAEEGYRGGELAAAVDAYGKGEGVLADLHDAPEADVIIDFSHHTAVGPLLAYACGRGLPVVIATTGHTEEERELIFAAAKKIPVFFSANMSVGVALLCSLARQAAAVLEGADIEIVEIHHNRKVDAPSGTALMLADAVREARPELKNHCGRSGQGKREQNEIGISALRMGGVVGTHEVMITTETQTITLKHEAYSRALFAEGALTAARFLQGKGAGLYDMRSMIGESGGAE